MTSKPHSVLDDLGSCFAVLAKFIGRHPEPSDLDALENLSKVKFGVQYLEEQLEASQKALLAILQDPLGSHGAKAVARQALGIPYPETSNPASGAGTSSAEGTNEANAAGPRVSNQDTDPASESDDAYWDDVAKTQRTFGP